MAKMPGYLEVEWPYQPTELDKVGCDGIYIKSIKTKWWGWPILVWQWLAGRQ